MKTKELKKELKNYIKNIVYYPNVTRFYQIFKKNEIKKTLKEVGEFVALHGISQIYKPIINRRFTKARLLQCHQMNNYKLIY